MKKDIFIKRFILSVFIFCFSFFQIALSPTLTNADSSPTPEPAIVKILPTSTDAFFQCPSLENIYDYLSVTPDSFWGYPIEKIEDIQSELGFNPFDLNELRNNGFDVQRPFGIAASNFKMVEGEDEPHFNLLLFLPAKDEKKAMAWIKQSIEKKSDTVQFQKVGETWKWHFNDALQVKGGNNLDDSDTSTGNEPDTTTQTDQTAVQTNQNESNASLSGSTDSADSLDENAKIDKTNDSTGETVTPSYPNYMAAGNGYILMGTNPSEDAGIFFEKMAQRLNGNGDPNTPTLSDDPKFIKVVKKLNASKDVLFYANIERIIKENPESADFFSLFLPGEAGMDAQGYGPAALASLELLKDYKALGFSTDLKKSDFIVDCYIDIVEESKLFNLFKGIDVKREIALGLKDNPVMLWGFTQDLQQYWQMLRDTLDKETLAKITEQFNQIKADHGVDMEADLINNLGNNFNMGIYDGMSINMGNINALLSLEFKYPSKIIAVIETLIKKMPEEKQVMVNRLQIGDHDVYMVPVGPFQLYAGFKGKKLLMTLGKPMFEKALAADPATGFMTAVKSRSLKNTLSHDHSIAYLDIMELYYVLKNFMPMFIDNDPDFAIAMTPEFQKLVDLFDYIAFTFTAQADGSMGDFVIKTQFDKPFFKGAKEVSDQISAMTAKE